MTFTSYQFIFGFLPLAFLGYALAHRLGGPRQATNFLAMISLVYYAMWGLPILLILLASIAFNFALGNLIARKNSEPATAKKLLLAALGANLLMLVYFKYTNFLIDVSNQFAGTSASHFSIVAPLGVSFFTFVQIGYLIDAYNGQLKTHNFARYIIFSAFFPCVTAGPLVLQKEMMDQLEDPQSNPLDLRRVTTGLTIFAMGLFKKIVLADAIAPLADSVFNGAALGNGFDTKTAWLGALCYTLQLYFDFSGYSDMAIGIATLFGIKLPLNFNSPFKSTNISDFWRRWHMTMTRFFTTYLYTGMAMNGMRRSMAMRLDGFSRFLLVAAMPSIFTFLVAGVWHGSGWNYVVYGLMHGIAIATYLGWREFSSLRLPTPAAWLLTMTTVVCGLVLFRANDLGTAVTMLLRMWNYGAQDPTATPVVIDNGRAISMIVLMGAITMLFPNTQQILHREWPVIDSKPEAVEMDAGLVAWNPSLISGLLCATMFAIAITSIGSTSGFLYYKF